jgi:hypothetical protein
MPFIEGGPCLLFDLRRVFLDAGDSASPRRLGHYPCDARGHGIVHDRRHKVLGRELLW